MDVLSGNRSGIERSAPPLNMLIFFLFRVRPPLRNSSYPHYPRFSLTNLAYRGCFGPLADSSALTFSCILDKAAV